MRALLGPELGDLAGWYAAPRTPWVRVNMVCTADGAAQGESGKSGSINNAADKVVFDTLRALADVVLVGAGTARTEGYRPGDTPIVVVSHRGVVPPSLVGGPAGSVRLLTHAAAPGLAETRSALGEEHVLVAGTEAVDLEAVGPTLADLGFGDVLCEGGPSLARDLLAAGLVDELCCTTVPRLIAGEHHRITAGAGVDVRLRLAGVLEQDDTLLVRWFTA